MSGYKNTVKNLDDAAAFWTFDGDAYDPVLLTSFSNPLTIIDEISNQNPGILHVGEVDYPGYALGYPSMIKQELTDNHSMAFAPAGRQPLSTDQFPKAFIEVTHTSSFNFPVYGSYSVEFMINKLNERAFGDYPTGLAHFSFSRPIISKASVFNCYLAFSNYGSNASLVVTNPGGTNLTYDYTNRLGDDTHIAFVWDVKPSEPGYYSGTASLYINSRLVDSETYSYYMNYPTTNITSSILIGGTLGTDTNTFSDRNTSRMILDQIAIYAKALDADMIANHYKKIYSYPELILRDEPLHYWRFNDQNVVSSTSVFDSVPSGKLSGNLYQQFLRQQPGPENIIFANSTKLYNGGCATFINESPYFYPIMNINRDYTIEFWLRHNTTGRGVIVGMQQHTPSYNGLLIEANMRNDQVSNGGIQFTERSGVSVSSIEFDLNNNVPYLFNDDKWHHYCITRLGDNISLWIDGINHDTTQAVAQDNGYTSQLFVMASMPGKLSVDGSISELALYTYGLQPQQVKQRYAYAVTYRIHGYVTLQGIPYSARVRFYDHITGELIKEIESDASTGEYLLKLWDSRKVDIMVFSNEDTNVRYRAYGPIVPAEYTDSPLLI